MLGATFIVIRKKVLSELVFRLHSILFKINFRYNLDISFGTAPGLPQYYTALFLISKQ